MGDRYIAAWSNGNERNQIGSCSNTYFSVVSPATAKNPIQVGASNTDNNTMTTFSSWGPTIDGRETGGGGGRLPGHRRPGN